MICCNEKIVDLKVDGKNREEIYSKFSVLDLGELPIKNSEKKSELLKKILELTRVLRKNLPSFYGFFLQACDKFISQEEFGDYAEITKHERLANLLKNVKNVFESLAKFCVDKEIEKPRSLTVLDVSSLTGKSELAIKLKLPDHVAQMLISEGIKTVITDHNGVEGVAFCPKALYKYPWLNESLKYEQDEVPAYSKMRSRKLYGESGEGKRVYFLRFDFLKTSTVEKLTEWSESQKKCDPKASIGQFFGKEFFELEAARKKTEQQAIGFVLNKYQDMNNNEKLLCRHCAKFCAKSSAGLKNHQKKCIKNK